MSQHPNLVLQEDLVFWGMIFNILETESIFSWKDSLPFISLLVRSWSRGSSVASIEQKASDFRPPWRSGGWSITVWSGAVQLSHKGKWRHWGSISYSRTLTFRRAYCKWVMGRVLGLEPGDPTVTICVTFTNLCNPSELQFPHLWNADDTYRLGGRFSEIMCVWSSKGMCMF